MSDGFATTPARGLGFRDDKTPFDASKLTRKYPGVIQVRKRPLVVHAVQLHFPEGFSTSTRFRSGFDRRTLDGTMRAKPGDWLIIGNYGERYPVDAEIFELTYDIIEET